MIRQFLEWYLQPVGDEKGLPVWMQLSGWRVFAEFFCIGGIIGTCIGIHLFKGG